MGIGIILIMIVAFIMKKIRSEKDLDTPTLLEVKYTEDISDGTIVR